MGLKDVLYNQKAKKWRKISDTASLMNGVNSCRRIAVLHDFTESNDMDYLNHYVKSWKGHEVTIARYLNAKDEDGEDLVFTKSDLNWFDFPKSEKLLAFLSEPFHLLISLNNSDIIDRLADLSLAQFKIGINSNNLYPYNLVINCGNSLNEVLSDTEKSINKIASQ